MTPVEPHILHLIARLDSAGAIDCHPSEVVCREGERATFLYRIESGVVSLSMASDDGSVCVVDVSGAGALIGLEALTPEGEHGCTVKCVTAVRLQLVERQALCGMLAALPTMVADIVWESIRALRRCQERLLEDRLYSVEERLARLLLQLSEHSSDGGGGRVADRPTHEMLAEMVGTTRPRVTSLMSAWRKTGEIEEVGRCLTVRDSIRRHVRPAVWHQSSRTRTAGRRSLPLPARRSEWRDGTGAHK